MGLLYQFPVKESELDDRVKISSDNTLTVKNYGLPYIFWGYLAAILLVIFFMVLAIKTPIVKVITSDDEINKFLGYALIVVLVLAPLSLLAFFFFDKEITKKGNLITIKQSIFWIPFRKKVILLKDDESLIIKHFMDSPNVAKLKNQKELRGFENQGYHELYAENQDSKLTLIDRNSRVGELKKLRELLKRY